MNKTLSITEIFGPTIQGEGPFMGKTAVFIRTFGCVPPFCKFCDTPYSWKGNAPQHLTTSEIVLTARLCANKNDEIMVITGGEPFAQSLIYKLEKELSNDYVVQFETSGKVRINVNKLSPKTYIVMSPKTYNKKEFNVDELTMRRLKKKYYSHTWFKFLYDPTGKTGYKKQIIDRFVNKWKIPIHKVFLMPIGHTRELQIKNLLPTTELALEKGYMLSPRLHTLIWDTKRGV